MFPTNMDEWVILEAFGRVPARRPCGVAPLRYEVALADYLENKTAHQQSAVGEYGAADVLRELRAIYLRVCDAAWKARFGGDVHPVAAPTSRSQR